MTTDALDLSVSYENDKQSPMNDRNLLDETNLNDLQSLNDRLNDAEEQLVTPMKSEENLLQQSSSTKK